MFVFLLVFVEINCSLGHFCYWGFIVYGIGNSQSEPKRVTDVEGDVGSSSETLVHRTNIYETPTPEGEPSMERNESSSGPDELGSTGNKIPLKWRVLEFPLLVGNNNSLTG